METFIRGVLRLAFSFYATEERNECGTVDSTNSSLSCGWTTPMG